MSIRGPGPDIRLPDSMKFSHRKKKREPVLSSMIQSYKALLLLTSFIQPKIDSVVEAVHGPRFAPPVYRTNPSLMIRFCWDLASNSASSFVFFNQMRLTGSWLDIFWVSHSHATVKLVHKNDHQALLVKIQILSSYSQWQRCSIVASILCPVHLPPD